MKFIESVRQRAAALDTRIAFPESPDPRVLEAAAALSKLGIARPVLIIDSGTQSRASAEATGLEVIIATYGSPLEYADSLVSEGKLDGCVAGAVYTSADVLRGALRKIGVRAGLTTVSSAFYMVAGSPWEASTDVLTFTDCAVVRYPTAQQLAEIAITAAEDRRRIVGDEPRVALLSFSTHGSAAGESVETILAALDLIRSRVPGLAVDGELQGD